jgi:hypothetical protein
VRLAFFAGFWGVGGHVTSKRCQLFVCQRVTVSSLAPSVKLGPFTPRYLGHHNCAHIRGQHRDSCLQIEATTRSLVGGDRPVPLLSKVRPTRMDHHCGCETITVGPSLWGHQGPSNITVGQSNMAVGPSIWGHYYGTTQHDHSILLTSAHGRL